MEIKHLRTFVTAAKLGSFVETSKQLDYAPSTITSQIQLLEEELKVKLFERLGKQISLTYAGQTLLVYAERLIDLSEEAFTAVSGEAPRGTITLGIAESLAIIRLSKVFGVYHQMLPDIDFDFKFGPCSEFKNYIRKNTIDAAIMYDQETAEQDLIIEASYPESMVLVCAPQHPLAQKQEIYPSDLINETLIISESGCSYRDLLEGMMTGEKARFRSIISVSSLQAEKQFAANGFGVCLLVKAAVKKDLDERSLVELPWKGPEFHISTQIIYHKDKWVSPALRVFLDLIDQELKIK
ncbi:LysR family transcriptional regulator [Clostridium guangxiense]|uniref:LysR family transcriptional regulator n=1 Tax=Clostridium guangxiense TaxID=1662055 RepID=UPI001E444EE9|nr:LysR family transcriptional regulator [Clostridium guangxiense]MCD2347163.1 LysR family transcriptional regulator [Clostridium guangxiense]